jgi:hypothetical protein
MNEIVFSDRVSHRLFVASFENTEGWIKVKNIFTLNRMTSGEFMIGEKVDNEELKAQAMNAVFLQKKDREYHD